MNAVMIEKTPDSNFITKIDSFTNPHGTCRFWVDYRVEVDWIPDIEFSGHNAGRESMSKPMIVMAFVPYPDMPDVYYYSLFPDRLMGNPHPDKKWERREAIYNVPVGNVIVSNQYNFEFPAVPFPMKSRDLFYEFLQREYGKYAYDVEKKP